MLNRAPNRHAPYVGESAFATKAGIHASAIMKDPATYEHVRRDTVGNRRKLLVSDQAGRSERARRARPHRPQGRQGRSADRPPARCGEGARGDRLCLRGGGRLVRTAGAAHPRDRCRTISTSTQFDVNVEQRVNANGERVTVSLAVVKVKVGDESLISAAEGNGPVNALDLALRKDLGKYQSYISGLELTDYRVRILNGGTEAVTRVLIESQDETGEHWTTVGVSPNIIDASFQALMDSIVYKLVKAGAPV